MTAETPLAKHEAETVEALEGQRRAWEERPIVRGLYLDWFAQIAASMSPVEGKDVEIGAGCGTFKEFRPGMIGTDVVPTPWADLVANAEQLPFEAGSVSNLVMIDVLHHVQRPLAALAEAARVLAPAGRMVMLEPYCSPLSTLGYRFLHHEDLAFDVDLEADEAHSSTDPLDANIALPTLIFWRRPGLLARAAPGLRVVDRKRLAWLVYPLSGGFTGTPLLPRFAATPALKIEHALNGLLAPLAGYRCLVILEKTPVG